MIVVATILPESHKPDESVSLKVRPIFRGFRLIFQEPQFYTYVLSGAVAFSGLFAYLAGSPVIFMKVFAVSAQTYGWMFAIIAAGLIGASQVNVLLLKRFTNEQILQTAYVSQAATGLLFLVGTFFGWYGITSTVILLFVFLSCLGFTNPNSAALALAPFAKNAGRAAALMGFLQMSIGAITSTAVGLFDVQEVLPVAMIMSATSSLALGILWFGRRRLVSSPSVTESALEISFKN